MRPDYLGCLYVYPSIAGEESADVVWWWWCTGRAPLDRSFDQHVADWLAGVPRPRLKYKLTKR